MAAVLCAFTAWGGYQLINIAIPTKPATILAIVLAVIVYFVFLLLFRAITKDDINMLPKGKKIAKTLENIT